MFPVNCRGFLVWHSNVSLPNPEIMCLVLATLLRGSECFELFMLSCLLFSTHMEILDQLFLEASKPDTTVSAHEKIDQ